MLRATLTLASFLSCLCAQGDDQVVAVRSLQAFRTPSLQRGAQPAFDHPADGNSLPRDASARADSVEPVWLQPFLEQRHAAALQRGDLTLVVDEKAVALRGEKAAVNACLADLDAIAAGQQQKDDWLRRFYFGDEEEHLIGLKRLVEENLDKIDAAEINTFPLGHDDNGELVVVKPGRYGPYVKRGEDTAGVPDDLTPDELDVAKAIELLALPKSDEPIGAAAHRRHGHGHLGPVGDRSGDASGHLAHPIEVGN